jgi:hypothetical protein
VNILVQFAATHAASITASWSRTRERCDRAAGAGESPEAFDGGAGLEQEFTIASTRDGSLLAEH